MLVHAFDVLTHILQPNAKIRGRMDWVGLENGSRFPIDTAVLYSDLQGSMDASLFFPETESWELWNCGGWARVLFTGCSVARPIPGYLRNETAQCVADTF